MKQTYARAMSKRLINVPFQWEHQYPCEKSDCEFYNVFKIELETKYIHEPVGVVVCSRCKEFRGFDLYKKGK